MRIGRTEYRSDFLGPQQRDLSVQPAAASEDHSSCGRMDTGTDCSRAKPGFCTIVHAAGTLGRGVQLGPDLGALVRRYRLHRVGRWKSARPSTMSLPIFAPACARFVRNFPVIIGADSIVREPTRPSLSPRSPRAAIWQRLFPKSMAAAVLTWAQR